MNRRLKDILINLLTIILMLVAIEIVSRFVLHKIYDRDFDSSLIVENKYSGSSGLKENTEGMVWGHLFHTDDNGCRKGSVAFDAKKKKWLFIGDSVTEGVGVDDSSTFSNLFAQRFSEFNICNYSMIGYSTSDYVNLLRTVLSSDSSIELVTLFYCLNDVYSNSKTADLPVIAKRNIIGKLNGLLQDHFAAYKLLKLFFYKNSNRYFTYDLQFYKKDDAHFVQAMNDLRVCDSLSRDRNIYFNVVILPYRSQMLYNNFVPQQLVQEFCQKDSIECSDAAEYLFKQPVVQPLYLFADEIHLSDKGHRAMADFLSQ